jgi:hypothetical protein
MRRLSIIGATAVILAGTLALGGCGSNDDDDTPAACLNGAGAYLQALRATPGEVTLEDGVPISGCLVENQKVGDLAAVGLAMLRAATVLNAEARKDPGGEGNLELGYLVGAAQRGAEQTGGIHSELVRRLATAAAYSPGKQVPGGEFEGTYRQGFDAGRDHG